MNDRWGNDCRGKHGALSSQREQAAHSYRVCVCWGALFTLCAGCCSACCVHDTAGGFYVCEYGGEVSGSCISDNPTHPWTAHEGMGKSFGYNRIDEYKE